MITKPVSNAVADHGQISTVTELSLADLLNAESAVLRRVARDFSEGPSMAGHNSSTSGHKSGGVHTSHSSSKIESPLQG